MLLINGENGMDDLSLIGAVTAIFIYTMTILVFIVRMSGNDRAEYWLGLVFLLAVFPVAYLLAVAFQTGAPLLRLTQLGLMLCFLLVEFILDYWLRSDFRHVRWAVILYVMLFFAGTGGMIGVASSAGRFWTISAVVLFLVMTSLAFLQHARTGE